MNSLKYLKFANGFTEKNIRLLCNDIFFMRYHFSEAYTREHDDAEDEPKEEYRFTDRADIISIVSKSYQLK